ncbi:MAG: ribosomal protein S18-alanine N-acetyltransferase [Gemmatimonadota bacterium]|nr:ribosomal protein S18-alanine N-acetyltransferase [Gemmatimonadota bacterium]
MRTNHDARANVANSEPRASIVLRAASDKDLDSVLAIEQASFADPWSRSAFMELLGDPRVAFLIADASGTVCGYVVAWFVLDEGEIGNLAVHAEAGRQGVGARLLDGAIAAVRKARVDSLYLEVRDSNAGARALYASRGFAEVGRRREYYRRPKEDALVLRLELAGAAPA